MGQAKRRNKELNLSKPLQGDDAFQVTLLGTCQATANVLAQRNSLLPPSSLKDRREYWVNVIQKGIEGLNLTYDGYVSEEFEKKFEKYHKWIEVDMMSLLKDHVNNKNGV